MQTVLIRRLAELVVVMWLLSILIFALVRMMPGDPATMFLGLEATPEAVAKLREEMGLNRSLPVQYVEWVRQVLQGNVGYSWVGQRPALTMISSALPATIQLLTLAIALALLLALPLGTLAAVWPRSWIDRLSTALVVSGISLPSFLVGILLILGFSQYLRWFPASGYVSLLENPVAGLRTTVLPATALAVGLAAPLARFLRSGLMDALRTDYVRTARAKGLSEFMVILRHALKNALLPVITILGLQLGALIGGAVITEQVFGWPGIGRLIVMAIERRDFGVIQAVVLFVGFCYMLINFAVDILYMLVDPRIRYT